MSKCVYTAPDDSRCEEPAEESSKFCFWHNPDAQKNDPEIKTQLEDKARNNISLCGYQLQKANLENAYFIEANLTQADLTRANLENGHLFGIDLRSTNLLKANLTNANLKEANLENADLLGANLLNADLERVHWGPGNRVINHHEANALASRGDKDGASEKYLGAEEVYRSIRKCYDAAGTADVAGEFFYNEMVAKRKQMPKWSIPRIWSWLVEMLCGYGEIPYRIIGSSITYILFNAFIYIFFGMHHGDQIHAFDKDVPLFDNITTLGYAIYFSIVTFTTLGYGDFSPVGWAKPFAAIEAFIGAFMIALFILAFVKKMTR
ncbi:MAG: pentapeptide repeat-containing protein [Candidatus Latescibacteria bacterium]|jgi:hypothetical protein|nr:pentapeptide repeat-containing protein [Candidatus Latescibacterota bacterium]